MTSYDPTYENFTEKYLGQKVVKVANTFERIIKKGELVYLNPWFGNAVEDIPALGTGYIDINHEREISTEQIDPTDTFTVGSVIYFDPGSNSAAGKLVDAVAVDEVAVGTITAAQGSAGAQTAVQFRPYVQKADLSGLDTRMTAAEGDIDALQPVAAVGGKPFVATGKISATTAGTAVHLLAATAVGTGKKIIVTGFKATVGGTTAWSGGTGSKLVLQDTNTSPVAVAEIAAAGLSGNAVLAEGTANVTLKAGIVTGLTAGKGLDIKGDNNFEAGSDVTVVVTGYIVDAA